MRIRAARRLRGRERVEEQRGGAPQHPGAVRVLGAGRRPAAPRRKPRRRIRRHERRHAHGRRQAGALGPGDERLGDAEASAEGPQLALVRIGRPRSRSPRPQPTSRTRSPGLGAVASSMRSRARAGRRVPPCASGRRGAYAAANASRRSAVVPHSIQARSVSSGRGAGRPSRAASRVDASGATSAATPTGGDRRDRLGPVTSGSGTPRRAPRARSSRLSGSGGRAAGARGRSRRRGRARRAWARWRRACGRAREPAAVCPHAYQGGAAPTRPRTRRGGARWCPTASRRGPCPRGGAPAGRAAPQAAPTHPAPRAPPRPRAATGGSAWAP